jgi:hypothetical protein
MVITKKDFSQIDSAPSTLYGKRDADSDEVYPVLVNPDGSLVVDSGGHNTTSASNTKISVGTTSTTVLALNAGRLEAIIVNDGIRPVYLNLSGTAVMNEGIRLNENGGSLCERDYTGIITAITSSGTINLTVVEK